MEQTEAIIVFSLFQIINTIILVLQWDNIKESLNYLPLRLQIGRLFIFILPILVVISLLINPI